MNEATRGAQAWLARWAGAPYAYLTTTGRRTGRPHRIEIWFAAQDGRMYLLAGGRERADWVRNLRANARVTVELGDETHAGAGRVIQPGTVEDQRARALLVGKYREGDTLDEWGRTALPIVIEFPTDGAPPPGTRSSSRRDRAAHSTAVTDEEPPVSSHREGRFQGKVARFTGGASGRGRATAARGRRQHRRNRSAGRFQVAPDDDRAGARRTRQDADQPRSV